ncbi:MAG: imidazole glycerol phosphate synthase subunit HisH [Gammaproteobacteria bacterium]|jgi:glutamine amidotransferase|nr:imidazole glycerol phosphate synthase subunit HisH [Gammaproteobacteria bacterium]HJN94432.1 imidazole glycerol phosphate synthase subunit HisH [Gammaproteobacteria bacterium]|tara:strand:- start:18532 stop:19188 length:657 start_codon:yes stop_codon:yes gene_type:complete
MNRIAVIDYGMGNLHSVAKAVEHVGRVLSQDIEVLVTPDAQKIAAADRVIFPGVGAIRDCMAEINRLNVGQIVEDAMKSKPVLAICVGMQALMNHSEENGGVDCLGLMDGTVRYFGDDLRDESGQRLKVPHMGWNEVKQSQDHPLWKDVPDHSRFYFVHSYYVQTAAQEQVTGTTHYGTEVVASVADDNIFATQFHPEKSQTAGLTLLRNFLNWDGQR